MNARQLPKVADLPPSCRHHSGIHSCSNAHFHDKVGDGLPEATAHLEHVGFQPGRRPEDFWTC